MKSTRSVWYKIGLALGIGVGTLFGCFLALLKLAILVLVAYGLYLWVT